MTERPSVVPDLLRRRAASDADAVALAVDGDGRLSFAEWDRRSSALARGLLARHVRGGDRVALLFDNARWLDYAAAYMGALKAGAVAVPLCARFSEAELAAVLAHCEAAAVVGPGDLLGLAGSGAAWRAEPGELEAGRATDDVQVAVPPGGLAEILYTSGTTGTAKGVACSHDNIVLDAPAGPGAVVGEQRVCFLHAFPVGTNAGQEVLRSPLHHGDRVAVALPAFDPERLCAAVARHRAQRLQLVPAMAQLVVASGAAARHDVSSVERIILSSAPAPPALLPRLAAAFPAASIWNAYTLTEAGPARTVMVYDPNRPGSVGRPVGEAGVRVVDEDGRDLPAGEVGEVWLRRPGVPRREYYRDEGSTAALYAGDWLRSGDLGTFDDGGYLHVVDRAKDVIVVGGTNVASTAVEHVLYEYPAVVDAAVFGVPHAVLGQDVAAAVVVSAPVTERELQAFARSRLAEHEVPHRIVFVDQLPRNPSGKVLKRELRERYRTAEPARYVGARTATEEAVVRVWGEVLDVERVGIHDDFFAIGGHSLAAAQVATRLQAACGVRIEVAALFRAPTVAELAALVDELQRSGAAPAPPLLVAVDRAKRGPTAGQPGGGGV